MAANLALPPPARPASSDLSSLRHPIRSMCCRASLVSPSSLLANQRKLTQLSRGFPSTPRHRTILVPSTRRASLAVRSSFDPLQIDSLAASSTQAASAAQNVISWLADAAADVTAAASAAADSGADAASNSGNWFSGLANVLESFLKLLEGGLTSLHVPYAYGFSIILLTVLVKAATFPLTKKQVESTLSMQSLAPKLKTIQTKFAGDQERIQLETARLYKQAGVNPLAGCLPTLATLPVWIGLYQALSNVAKEGELSEGFFWIPSLAGPASLAARDAGSGVSWLFNWVDGTPPLGWSDTAAYLVLPVLLVASQYYSMQILQPPQSDDPAQKNTQLILKFLPIMIGWFALSVPSGLSLYWFTNNILSTAQTVYLRKMGGAKPAVTAEQVTEIIDVGQAKRSSGNIASEEDKARAERFQRLKQMEAERRAARRAAEEAARAAAIEAQKEREELAGSSSSSSDSAQQSIETPAVHAAEAVEEPDVSQEEAHGPEENGKALPVSPVSPPKVSTVTAGSSARPAGRRSKRTRRSGSRCL